MERRGFIGLLGLGLLASPLLLKREEIPIGTRIEDLRNGIPNRKEYIYGVATSDIKANHLGFVQTFGECKVACR